MRFKKIRILPLAFLLAAVFLAASCGSGAKLDHSVAEASIQAEEQAGNVVQGENDGGSPPEQEDTPPGDGEASSPEKGAGAEESAESPEESAEAPAEAVPRPCVAIDPGHQSRANLDKEPIGPGAAEQKMKVSDGTAGPYSGLREYELTLQVSLLLREELSRRGYAVVMTRVENDVDISNVERAEIAKNAGADVFVRIHADGSEDPSAQGAMTICMTPGNPYCAQLYGASRRLSDRILSGIAEETGRRTRAVWETDTMTGINWAAMPVTIVEMGFMSNREEDLLLADPAYQNKIVQGIAKGIDQYFADPAPAGE